MREKLSLLNIIIFLIKITHYSDLSYFPSIQVVIRIIVELKKETCDLIISSVDVINDNLCH